MSLANTTLSTSMSIIYQSTGNSVVSVLYLCNTATTAVGFNLYLVPSGGMMSNTTNLTYNNIIIEANDTYVIDTEKLILGAGDFIGGSATADGIVVSFSYINY